VIWYGGDYNPEQWPEEVWAEDTRLMQEAGVTMVSLGIFSWAMLEPREGEFEFGWLDRVMDGLHAGGVRVDLATATASSPPWLTHRYPEVLPVTKDGVRLSAGSGQQYCPSSPVYRRLAARLASKIAERYADHPALAMWHINNEYGCHVSHCYCETSADAFRAWLQARHGTVDALNAAWGTAFWSQRYSEFCATPAALDNPAAIWPSVPGTPGRPRAADQPGIRRTRHLTVT
jgi:beta-galactosidase